MTNKTPPIIKDFREKFVADNVLDCIPEKNWEEMKGEIETFWLSKLKAQHLATIKEVGEGLEKRMCIIAGSDEIKGIMSYMTALRVSTSPIDAKILGELEALTDIKTLIKKLL